jgi:hypothetical protein
MDIQRVNFTIDKVTYKLLQKLVKHNPAGGVPNRSLFIRNLIIEEAKKAGLL